MQGMVSLVYPYFRQMAESFRAVMISVLSSISFCDRKAASLSIVRTEGMVRLRGSCIPFLMWRKAVNAPSEGLMP